ncbi:hypothetical protein GUITHDRAFT_111786 [Guillardia theta CCMP2712]|uniref:Methyltransferase small domain-containing protein n=1 Tax=Guillardia theta (strain CCMP2712) TaxID=905079 RepID=L1J116_GUITC|nr:hypothetical protein GUITHDRAFT_111786 [Guillardia theta CCMP2712]EKX42223.1 hypothetical protein GUITHDRAFT_111786 [Guillardia theta CCMP2712]|eukprot:XP_005829203.1 hypothetical protein GUITHDRAFT_111786 [Guillardia theta CCMP2712]
MGVRIKTGRSVHFDPENVQLFINALLNLQKSRQGARVLDLGCGTGLWGLLASKILNPSILVMVDNDPCSVELARNNAASNEIVCETYCGDLYQAIPADIPPFDVVLCNPPQTGGPLRLKEERPDKYGGEDGADFFDLLARDSGGWIADGGCIIFSQHGLAHPKRVLDSFHSRGYSLRIIAEQERVFERDAVNAACEGLWEYQLKAEKEGRAELELSGERCFTSWQRVYLASRDGFASN